MAHFSCRRPQVVAGDNLGALTGQLGCRETAKGVDAGQQVVRQKLESLTGERWSRGELEALFTLFDPRAAADNALSALSDEAFSLWLQETPPEELERWRP